MEGGRDREEQGKSGRGVASVVGHDNEVFYQLLQSVSFEKSMATSTRGMLCVYMGISMTCTVLKVARLRPHQTVFSYMRLTASTMPSMALLARASEFASMSACSASTCLCNWEYKYSFDRGT